MSTGALSALIENRGFDAFQDGLKARFHRFGLRYRLTYCEPTDNPAMRLEFESETHLGRVTVSVSGACDLQVLDVRSGRDVLFEHHELASEAEFHEKYPAVPLLMKELAG
jgi:hypothetical protein